MGSLYDSLQVRTDATDEELRKNYKMLSYRYKCEAKDEKLIQINGAIKILSDPYQRSFYDTFGEIAVNTLLKPEDGYVFPRLFSRANLCCILAYGAAVLFNMTGWFYMYRLFDRYVFRNILFIISPVFLLLIHANLLLTLRRACPYITRFRFWGAQLVLTSLEILAISLFLDGILHPVAAIATVLGFEVATIVYFVRRDRGMVSARVLVFRICKAALLPLFCIPGFQYRMLIPAALLVLFSTLIFFMLFVVEMPVLAYLIAAQLLCDGRYPGWVAHTIFIPYNALALLLVLGVVGVYRRIPKPGSLLDQRILLALESPDDV